MSTVAVVYWSGTGNTAAMAKAVEEGAANAGAEVSLFEVSEFSASDVSSYDAFAFGCPAMGAEELETDEFEPVWDECVSSFGTKPVGLFGSYDWGVGEWMDIWKDAAVDAGVNVVATVIANNDPDDDEVAACNELGETLAK
ncbi:MAG: flavodoxin [Atopobiaceae bacterium]|nr:flavodoxin [Atopobiaceae bacterium]